MFNTPHTPALGRRLVALAASTILLAACSSKNEAAPQTGSIQGVVGPPGSASLATATNNQNQTFTAVPDRQTGAYTMSNLPPGPYTVRFTPTMGFTAMSQALPMVQPNQTISAGANFMTLIGTMTNIHGIVTWQHEGKLWGPQQLGGNVNSDSLRIEGLSCADGGTDVLLRVKPFAGVGTYSLGTGTASAVFRRYLPTGIVSYTATGASGTLTITRYEAATRTVVGTFAFTAHAVSPATGTAAVTGGTIDLRL